LPRKRSECHPQRLPLVSTRQKSYLSVPICALATLDKARSLSTSPARLKSHLWHTQKGEFFSEK
jgi:hypothetical protein